MWVSNQIRNSGVLTGFEQFEDTMDHHNYPNPDAYKLSTVTGASAENHELSLTEPDFRFP